MRKILLASAALIGGSVGLGHAQTASNPSQGQLVAPFGAGPATNNNNNAWRIANTPSGSKEAGPRHGLKPRAKIRAFTNIGSEPAMMLTGPVDVTEKLFERSGMKKSDIDLFELNEAFASVVLRYMQAFDIDNAKINVNGGAIALGHPLGASGTKLMTTLVYALKDRNKRYGLQTMCEGGGVANVTIIERLS